MPPTPQGVYLLVAKREFLRDTGCDSPEQAIQRGIRTVTDWVQALDAARAEFKVGEYTFKRNVAPDPFRHIHTAARAKTPDAKRVKREALQSERMERVRSRREAVSKPQPRSKL